MARWKAIELMICRIFGGERAGKEGRHGCDCKDTGHYAVQVKHRTCPKWLIDAMEQTIRDAEEGQLPVLVLHPKGANIHDSIVMIRLSEFREWHL